MIAQLMGRFRKFPPGEVFGKECANNACLGRNVRTLKNSTVARYFPVLGIIYVSGSRTFSDRVPFVGPVPSTRTTLFQEKSMCQI